MRRLTLVGAVVVMALAVSAGSVQAADGGVDVGGGQVCAVAGNGSLSCWGQDVNLQTSGPDTAAGVFRQVGGGQAHTSGTLNPRNGSTAFTFEYRTTTSFGNIAAIDRVPAVVAFTTPAGT